ncbi:MAG: hypothetical protein O2783_05520, partial [Chloroflexi bacterium]|nr:hypothetical protein [Chloroflexota bacterium]
YLGHHDSFQLGLIYPSEGASTTPKSLGFIRPQKVSKIADVLQLKEDIHRGKLCVAGKGGLI